MRGGVLISGDDFLGAAIPSRSDQVGIAITEPSFETTTGWTYTETSDLDYSDQQSTSNVTDGTYCHELIGTANLDAGSYCRYSQTLDMTYFDALLTDIYFVGGNNNDNIFAIIRINSNEEWRDTVRADGSGAQNNKEIDISSYTGSNALHFEMYANNNHYGNQREYYFDNIRLGRTIVSPAIRFSWASGASAWDKLYWNESGANGDFRVTVQCFTGGTWQDVAGLTNLDYNPSGTDISSLGTEDSVRLVGKFVYSAGSPTVSDWTVTWNYSNIGVELYVGDDTGARYNTTTWDLDTIAPGTVRIMNTSDCVYVKNTGSVAMDVEIQASAIVWKYAAGSSARPDTVCLMGLFNGNSAPSAADFDTLTDYIITSYRTAGAGDSGAFGSATNDGTNITVGAGEKLYIYFGAPTVNSYGAQQVPTITVKGVAH